MWVPKVPRRWDFCGCPPCGLCFDWAEPRREPKVVRQEEPNFTELEVRVMAGLDKMVEDLLGKPADQATPEEKGKVELVAEQMHERNIIRAASGEPPPEPEGGATFQEAENQKWFEKRIAEKAKNQQAEREYQERLNRRKNLDSIDWNEETKKAEKEQEEKLKKEAEAEARKQAMKPDRQEQKEREKEAYERLRRKYDYSYDPRKW